jgi:hypothetical protein
MLGPEQFTLGAGGLAGRSSIPSGASEPKYEAMSLPPAYLRQKLTQPLPTKDGAVLRTIGEAANYMLALPHRAGHRLVIPASTAPGRSKRDKDRAKPIKHIGNGGATLNECYRTPKPSFWPLSFWPSRPSELHGFHRCDHPEPSASLRCKITPQRPIAANERAELCNRWRRAAELILDQADVAAVSHQVHLALFYDAQLDLGAMERRRHL